VNIAKGADGWAGKEIELGKAVMKKGKCERRNRERAGRGTVGLDLECMCSLP